MRFLHLFTTYNLKSQFLSIASSYTSADEYFDVTDPSGVVKAVNTEKTTDRDNQINGAADTSSKQGFGYLNLGKTLIENTTIE